MAGDERMRIDLGERLTQVVGRDLAAYMMQTIPPMPWSDLTTKDDLANLSEVFELKLETVKHELRGDIKDGTSRVIRWVVPTVIGGMSVSTGTIAVVTALLS
jgi:hypothetical protein